MNQEKQSKYTEKENNFFMDCRKQNFVRAVNQPNRSKVKKYRKQIHSMDCRNQKYYKRIASNKQIQSKNTHFKL
jgi:hypothetical protein